MKMSKIYCCDLHAGKCYIIITELAIPNFVHQIVSRWEVHAGWARDKYRHSSDPLFLHIGLSNKLPKSPKNTPTSKGGGTGDRG